MKKTKIICTMGPNTNDRELVKQMALAGMDIARFNFSHGDHEEQKGRVDIIKSVRDELGIPIAMLLDTKGPEIRTGVLKDDIKLDIKDGQKFTLTTRNIVGNENEVSITYSGLPADVSKGNVILIDDGLIELHVEEVVNGTDIVCKVINGGLLGQKKGVNVPNVSIRLPAITDKDKDDILFAIEQGYDFIAASFVRNAACIQEIKEILWSHDCDIPVIAKIENAEGIANIDEIIKVSDGIMVARGDMGVEIPAQDVPHIQKMIIKKCNAAYKPVITATQLLASMMRNPRPTRAEVTDVANAETTEQHLDLHLLENAKLHSRRGISSAVSNAAVSTAASLNAKAIICPTMSGFTARLISKLKPAQTIIGASPNEDVLRKMQLYWGVRPLKTAQERSSDMIFQHAIDVAENAGYIEEGDTVVMTGGVATSPTSSRRGLTNMIRVQSV